MISESPLEILPEVGMRPGVGGGGNGEGFGEDLEKELGLLLGRQEASDRERELNIFRSGSAPPSVEGSLSAVEGLRGGEFGHAGILDYRSNANGVVSEEELRSDPAYLAYYYTNVNLNPRLPQPVMTKEDWRFSQRLHFGSSVLGGIGDRRKVNRVVEGGGDGSQNSQYLGAGSEVESRGVLTSGEWTGRGCDGLIGLPGLSIGNRNKSSGDVFQDDLSHGAPFPGQPSRPTSRNAFDDNHETLGNHDVSSADGHRVIGNGQKVANVQQPIGPSTTQTFASVLGGSLSRSTTPDPQRIARAPSPCLPPVGVRINTTEKKGNNGISSFNNFTSGSNDSVDIALSLSEMNLSRAGEIEGHGNFLYDAQGGLNTSTNRSYMKRSNTMSPTAKHSYPELGKSSAVLNRSNTDLLPEERVGLRRPGISSANSYLKVPSGSSVISPGDSPVHYQNPDSPNAMFTNYGGGYPGSPELSMSGNHIGNLPLYESAVAASMLSPTMDSRGLGGFSMGPQPIELQLNRMANQAAGLQVPLIDPSYLQYLRTADYASQLSPSLIDPSIDRNYGGNSYDLLGLQKAYLEAMLSPQNQNNMPFLGKSSSFGNGYYGSPNYGLGMSYPGSPLVNSLHPASPGGSGSPMRHGDRAMRYPSNMRNITGLMGSYTSDEEGFASTLLDEFKSNKTRCFELSEIAGHVVEFSSDQYGSRFIQQKLETATTDEKNMVFQEISPRALALMTDVFGNYVIQKFFEHGTAAQRRELADKLTTNVLQLSLQMYGCRVIQKAIEVVDIDQQIKMVEELDGQIMRCVRDQNGNHVIQKCIECIPQEAIQFIISSFYDQVVTLSTHPYGCRVIQRVLEHCDDPKTQQIVMDEIMQRVCMLAQDQYGNYVVQHVLEHGKPEERSAIITQLAGQIVQMSQQKFASNVVEKCLTFGGPREREILVNEMLGSTDENEPLQAMMKDQFGNYVVQKVLETCDDQQRELILSRIKVHLNALKKYTYGKHIVARVEKLVTAGERRIGVQTSYSS